MTTPWAGRSGVSRSLGAVPRSLGAALAFLAATALVLIGVEVAILLHGGGRFAGVLTLYPAAAFVYIATGLLAWSRRPSNWIGRILIGGGVIWLLAALAGLNVPALAAVGVVLATVILAVVVHLLHAFPSGRLRSRTSRVTVGAGYAVCLLLQVPLYLFAPAASPNGILAVVDRPGWRVAGVWLQRGAGIAVMVVTAVVLAGRLHAAPAHQRRVLGPLYLYGIVAVLLVPLVPTVVQPLVGISNELSTSVQIALLAVIPAAFAGGVLLGGFARTSEIQELGAWLGADAAQRPGLEEALARTLGDRSVRLAFWVSEAGGYVDACGRPVSLPAADSELAAVEVELDGRRIGAICYDGTLVEQPELVRAAGRVIALAIDQQRLTAELLASQEALRVSRARIVEAGDRERRRIAQQLHDGLQGELVLLAVQAQSLAGCPGATAEVSSAAIRLRERIDAAARGLRELVHQVMPAPLIERGLAAATEDLVDRMPVPTHLQLNLDGPLPAPVQATAYLVVAEGLTNAVKHAHASTLNVRLNQTATTLTVQIDDDGVGGASAGPGLGLRSLADRVDVLGGRLRVASPAGRGTRLVAELPCGS